MPCGRSAHLELGYAVGAGKLTLVYANEDYCPGFEPELMWKMASGIVTSTHELLEAMRESAPHA